MVQQIPVGKEGAFALVDDEDVALVSQYKWHVTAKGYAQHSFRKGGKTHSLLMHRLILGLGPGGPHVDHANQDRLDNRRFNIRRATVSQNRANAQKMGGDASSKYKGITWNRTNQRWQTSICVHRKVIWLGYFDAEIDAARAYDSAAAHFFGEFACSNFPNEIPAPYMPGLKPSSTCRGVCYCPTSLGRKKWKVGIMRNDKRYWVGRFLTESRAIAALQAYKQEHGL